MRMRQRSEPTSDVEPTPPPSITAMGFNPFRPHERDPADIAMVVGAVLLTVGVLAWALWG